MNHHFKSTHYWREFLSTIRGEGLFIGDEFEKQ
jgi:hypothetical protein